MSWKDYLFNYLFILGNNKFFGNKSRTDPTEGDLGVHLLAHMAHVAVDHGQGDAHGEDGHHGEGDGGERDEAICLQPALQVHRQQQQEQQVGGGDGRGWRGS